MVLAQEIQKNSVVQVNEKGPEGWVGCLLQVDSIRTWGVQAWVQIPMGGGVYMRLKWEQIDYIGEAVLAPPEEESELE